MNNFFFHLPYYLHDHTKFSALRRDRVGHGSLLDRPSRPNLTGKSSLWMFPIYGSAAFLAPVMKHMKDKPVFKRGLVYMTCIFGGEYISGLLLKRRGMCPWDYSKSPLQCQGVIRLDYAPVWFLVGLFYERLLTR